MSPVIRFTWVLVVANPQRRAEVAKQLRARGSLIQEVEHGFDLLAELDWHSSVRRSDEVDNVFFLLPTLSNTLRQDLEAMGIKCCLMSFPVEHVTKAA